jgi:hypothetical protein
LPGKLANGVALVLPDWVHDVKTLAVAWRVRGSILRHRYPSRFFRSRVDIALPPVDIPIYGQVADSVGVGSGHIRLDIGRYYLSFKEGGIKIEVQRI